MSVRIKTTGPWTPAMKDGGEYPGLLDLCDKAIGEALEFMDGKNVERNQLELELA